MSQALMSLRVYSDAVEGYNSEEPWGEHDVLAHSFPACYVKPITYRGVDWPSVELIPEVGCIRPKLLRAPIDQTLVDWSFSGGDWAAEGLLGQTVLVQQDATPDSMWTATTVADFPENPRFEFFLWAYQFPQDWSIAPYLILEVGEDYRVWLGEADEAIFCQRIAGEWSPIDTLAWEVVQKPGYLWWDPLAGGLSLSMSWGKSRVTWGATPDLDLTTVTVPAAPLKIYGCNHACFLAVNELHVVDVDEALMESGLRGTYEHRGGVWVPDVDTWSRAEPQTGIQSTDLSSTAPPAHTKWRAQFNTDFLAAGGEDNPSFVPLHRLPELYAVDVEQDRTLVAALDWTDPNNYIAVTGVQSVEIEHSPEGGWTAPQTARVTIPISYYDAFSADYRFRFCTIYLDDYRATGMSRAFCGVISNLSLTESVGGEVLLNLDLAATPMFWAQRVRQERHWPVLGGMTDTAARDTWMKLLGLPTARGAWTTTGAALPKGPPAEPFGAPYEGTEALELLHRIDWATQMLSYFDATDGTVKNIRAQDFNTVGSVVSFYKSRAAAEAGGDRWMIWQDLSVTDESAWDLATRWKAVGRSASGDYLSARATDWAAERQPASWNFVGRPLLQMVDGCYPTQGSVALAALSAYTTRNRAWRKVSWTSPGLKTAIPPMWAYLKSAKKIGDTDPVRVIGLRHRWAVEAPGGGRCATDWEGLALVTT